MCRNVTGLKFLVILAFLASMSGCSKKDDVQALKEQLVKTQEDVEYWRGRYDAVSEDYKNAKAVRRDLNTQLDTATDSVDAVSQQAQTVEQQLYQYEQQIADLQAQIQDLNSFIDQQDQIIADQEAAFQEFMNMVGQPTDAQTQAGTEGY